MEPLTYICDQARHLVCLPFSRENLHRMATELGIKRCWFHPGKYPHYDIPKRRIQEITQKCHRVVSSREVMKVIKGESIQLSENLSYLGNTGP